MLVRMKYMLINYGQNSVNRVRVAHVKPFEFYVVSDHPIDEIDAIELQGTLGYPSRIYRPQLESFQMIKKFDKYVVKWSSDV